VFAATPCEVRFGAVASYGSTLRFIEMEKRWLVDGDSG
jgi:hypothetical protein